jgi:hypothetical protein
LPDSLIWHTLGALAIQRASESYTGIQSKCARHGPFSERFPAYGYLCFEEAATGSATHQRGSSSSTRTLNRRGCVATQWKPVTLTVMPDG